MDKMEVQDYIEKIIDNDDIESMKELSRMLEDTIDFVKREDERTYKKHMMKLYKMAYGETLSRDMAEDIVENMRPYGMRWTLEEVKDLQDKYGYQDIRSVDMFVVMNSAYNDYKDLFGDDNEAYVRFAVDFIEDEDAADGKVFKYFTTIPRMEV